MLVVPSPTSLMPRRVGSAWQVGANRLELARQSLTLSLLASVFAAAPFLGECLV